MGRVVPELPVSAKSIYKAKLAEDLKKRNIKTKKRRDINKVIKSIDHQKRINSRINRIPDLVIDNKAITTSNERKGNFFKSSIYSEKSIEHGISKRNINGIDHNKKKALQKEKSAIISVAASPDKKKSLQKEKSANITVAANLNKKKSPQNEKSANISVAVNHDKNKSPQKEKSANISVAVNHDKKKSLQKEKSANITVAANLDKKTSLQNEKSANISVAVNHDKNKSPKKEKSANISVAATEKDTMKSNSSTLDNLIKLPNGTMDDNIKFVKLKEKKLKKRKLSVKDVKAKTLLHMPEDNDVNVKCSKLEDTKTNFEDEESRAEDVFDSNLIGFQKFTRLISPTSPKTFFRSYWEKKPLYINRSNPNCYGNLLTTIDLHNIFKNRNVQFGKNLDVTAYINGKRETKDLEGRAFPSRVWDMYNSGCSIRMLNPQTFHKPVWRLLSSLQEYFGSFCGANVYLTPPGTQGFAPHWDDIDAFVLQLEGKKHWRVYKPRCDSETLPRESSRNFGPDDDLRKPVIDCVLSAGDLLYFPRGFIHQGEALPDCHSLHITLSTYQKTSWIDYLEKLVPACLASAGQSSLTMRKGLPIGYLNEMGIANSDKSSAFRTEFINQVKEHMNNILDEALIDGAADQMAKEFIHSALPPVPSLDEQSKSIFDGGEFWTIRGNKVVNRVEINPDTPVRLLRRNCIRLVSEEDCLRLYYTIDNSREYRAEELKFLEIDEELGVAIENLLDTYPAYIKPEDLPLEDLESKMVLVSSLWENGILITEDILDPSYD